MDKSKNEELVNLIICLLRIMQHRSSTTDLERIYNFVNNRFIGRGC